MSRFGYSEDRAERAKIQLDRDLQQVEYLLRDRIGRTIPHAGAITTRLDEARESIVEIVVDLQDLIDERTDAGTGSSAGSGSDISSVALSVFGFDYWDEPGAGAA